MRHQDRHEHRRARKRAAGVEPDHGRCLACERSEAGCIAMDVDECKIGVLPNMAINPETRCHAVTGEPVEYPSDQGDGLRTACYDYERRIEALTRERDDAQAMVLELAADALAHIQDRDRWMDDYDKLARLTQELVVKVAELRGDDPDTVAAYVPFSDEYEGLLSQKQHVIEVQGASFRKMEVEISALRSLALGMWRCLDTLLLAHRAPTQAQIDGWAQSLAARGIEAE